MFIEAVIGKCTRGGAPGVAALAAVALLATAPSAGADIGRANLDGSGAERSFIATPDREGSPSLGVAVDGEHIYWSSDFDEGLDEAGAIGRANLNGSGVVQRFIAAPDAGGVAVDDGHLYWGSRFDNNLWRANLDGSGASSLIVNAYPAGLALGAGHLYWIADGGEKFPADLNRANLDGSNVETIISFDSLDYGPALAVDGDHVYWTGRGVIARANLDGSASDTSFITTPDAHVGIAVDGEHIYWSNFHTGTIGRANVDGSGVDPSFITGAGCVAGVAVDGEHVYWTNEGTCSDDAVAVAIKGKRRTLRGRDAAVKLRVPPDEASPPVLGTLKLKTRKLIRFHGDRRRLTLAEDSLRITSGRTKAIRLRLSKSKAKLIRSKKKARKVRAIVQVEDQAGNEARVTKNMKLTPRG